MYDILIKEGTIVDFEKNQTFVGDLGIDRGKITLIGQSFSPAKKVIDASGKIVSPGFIDIHMHEEEIKKAKNVDPYDIANYMVLMGVTTGVVGNCGDNQQGIKDFFNFIDKNGSPMNYMTFLGQNYLRNIVGIEDRYRSGTKYEVEKMKKLIVESVFEIGAIGISFGLEYSPGVTFEEILELCESVGEEDILLSAHYRKDAKKGVESIRELINISEITGKPMQVSHIGSCVGFGNMKEGLNEIEKAIEKGVDIAADCYPYNAFSTRIGSAVFDEGCFENWDAKYGDILLTEEPYKGIRCSEEIFYKVRKDYPDMLVVAFAMNEEEIVEALKAPFVYIASDGLYNRGQGHPRGAGTFPRVLGKYVRDEKKLEFIDTLKKMTKFPADRLGLRNKGEIKEGMDADIVIFDFDKVEDYATFKNPTLPPKGIEYVLVNGSIAVEKNKIINKRLGKAIKRNKS